jgi:antitoxin CptB
LFDLSYSLARKIVRIEIDCLSIMNELSQLKWRCRRGMKELDFLLLNYLECRYEQASLAEQQAFKTLLDKPNTDLYTYLLGQQIPEDAQILNMVNSIKHLAQL